MKNLFKYIIIVLSFLLLVPYAMADDYWGMMGGNFWPFSMVYGFIFMIVFWGIIIYFIILLSKYISNKNEKETPLDILKKRLAKGEISEEEFEKIKKKI